MKLTARGERLMVAYCWAREQWPYLAGVLLFVAACSVAGIQ